jgi:hypothetical protein
LALSLSASAHFRKVVFAPSAFSFYRLNLGGDGFLESIASGCGQLYGAAGAAPDQAAQSSGLGGCNFFGFHAFAGHCDGRQRRLNQAGMKMNRG